MPNCYELTLVRHEDQSSAITQTLIADAALIAAWCRSIADELDPTGQEYMEIHAAAIPQTLN